MGPLENALRSVFSNEWFIAGIAQSVEQLLRKQRVAGSIPVPGTSLNQRGEVVPEKQSDTLARNLPLCDRQADSFSGHSAAW